MPPVMEGILINGHHQIDLPAVRLTWIILGLIGMHPRVEIADLRTTTASVNVQAPPKRKKTHASPLTGAGGDQTGAPRDVT